MCIYFLQSAPVCRSRLTLTDISTGEAIQLGDTNVTISETNITFATQGLREDHYYNVTVTASNIAGSAVSHIILSML